MCPITTSTEVLLDAAKAKQATGCWDGLAWNERFLLKSCSTGLACILRRVGSLGKCHRGSNLCISCQNSGP